MTIYKLKDLLTEPKYNTDNKGKLFVTPARTTEVLHIFNEQFIVRSGGFFAKRRVQKMRPSLRYASAGQAWRLVLGQAPSAGRLLPKIAHRAISLRSALFIAGPLAAMDDNPHQRHQT